MRVVALSLFLVPLALGCSNPVSVSDPVGIVLKTKSGEATNGTVTSEKSISSEAGNPYGAFIKDARDKLGGDPSRIELDSLTLVLGGKSIGVTGLEQVFTGKVDALFVMNESNNTFPVGTITDPSGTGPVPLDVTFDSSQFVGDERSRLLAGSFKVVLRGPASAGYATKGAEAELQLNFTFTAFE